MFQYRHCLILILSHFPDCDLECDSTYTQGRNTDNDDVLDVHQSENIGVGVYGNRQNIHAVLILNMKTREQCQVHDDDCESCLTDSCVYFWNKNQCHGPLDIAPSLDTFKETSRNTCRLTDLTIIIVSSVIILLVLLIIVIGCCWCCCGTCLCCCHIWCGGCRKKTNPHQNLSTSNPVVHYVNHPPADGKNYPTTYDNRGYNV